MIQHHEANSAASSLVGRLEKKTNKQLEDELTKHLNSNSVREQNITDGENVSKRINYAINDATSRIKHIL